MAESLGRWRRIYATGVIQGRRINAVSWQAEAWFWRLTLIADDYGVVPNDPDVLVGTAAPKKKPTRGQIRKWTAELEQAELLTTYAVDGEDYMQLFGFDRFQRPANGRMVHRYPTPLRESGANGAIRSKPNHPGEGGSLNSEPRTQTRPETTQRPPPLGGAALGSGSGGEAGGCADALVSFGVAAKRAKELARTYTTARLLEVIAYVRKQSPDKPAGLAIHCLEQKSTELDITPEGHQILRMKRAAQARRQT
ncbi:MAG: hypothetical protein DWQ20_00895 [Actinobacteria bacterium]|nr:MAG: hypothetical protein DWQ20_00895 [Actinomycetota bacterium]